MQIKKKALLYDIANIAFVIADTGDDLNHSLHRVRDVCEEGNLDRVARVLGLAYSQVIAILSPVIDSPEINVEKDFSEVPRNYPIDFSDNPDLKFVLTAEMKLKIKETVHEYMVAMVLADWLGITYPVAADVWKDRAEQALVSLKEIAASMVTSTFSGGFKRRISVF